jgi:hypothetical protein
MTMSRSITDVSRGRLLLALCTTALLLLFSSSASAQYTRCNLTYEVSGWSFIYKYAKGTGTITCADGQTANVKLVAHGGGFSLGTQSVKNGRGRFSGTLKIEHLYGTYIEVDSHAGVGEGRSVDARAMFKGRNRLSATGKGGGFSVGFVFGGFTIKPQ